MAKQCPIMILAAAVASVNKGDIECKDYGCIKGKCAFWSSMYTTEGKLMNDCVFVLNALKNANGKIPRLGSPGKFYLPHWRG